MISIITPRKNTAKLSLIIILLVCLTAVAGIILLTKYERPQGRPTNATVDPGYYLVESVVDGDTIKAVMDGKVESIRLIGIDAPELPDDCFAREAKSRAQRALAGQQIKLEVDNSQDNRDIYGRLLRYVVLEDDTNLNRLMIAEGYAQEFTFIEPYDLQAEFRQAQAEAKKNEIGLWAPKAC
ncbi:MAG TPA: thermonuclease family protein [Candidatus Saccharimonadales bacterium]|nr:thermonuclease family protein [Candidatus Saccharimonadales bacterium]